MLQNSPSIYVGLDVHKESLAIAIASPERGGEIRFYGNIPNQQQRISHLFLKIKKQYSSIMACYEAGPCGYNIYHQLTAMDIECIVVAPSRIPKSPTDRIKNDHRDAVGLARLVRAGELTPVWIPDLTHEAMRDLVRARTASKQDSRIARQRIQSILLRNDRRYDKKPWSFKHRIPGHYPTTGFLFGSITTTLLLASDHFDSLHRTLLKHRSMTMSYW